MSDTIQKIADEVATYQAPPNGQYIQVHPRVMRDWEVRLRALSARASAGEGEPIGYVDPQRIHELKEGRLNIALFAERMGGNSLPLYAAAPQPAQAGASGGGDVPDDVAERCRTYDSARLLQCALEVYARSCMYNTEAQHNAAMAYRDELLRRLTPASAEPREAFAWMKAGPSGTPLLHTVTQNIKIREEWEANGWVSIPIFLPTPPAHGDGEGARNAMLQLFDLAQDVHQKMPEAGEQMIELLRIVRTTRPTPEAQEARDAARLRYVCEHNWIGAKTRCERGIMDSDIASLRAAIDAALALPAQGEGENG